MNTTPLIIALIIFGIAEFALGYCAGRLHQYFNDLKTRRWWIEKKGD